jgi:hypothetical protein
MATIEPRKVERNSAAYAVQPMDLKIGDGEFVVLSPVGLWQDDHAAHDLWPAVTGG